MPRDIVTIRRRGGYFIPSGGGPFSPTSTQSSNFLARTSGLTDLQKGRYDALITGLVNDGVWSKLDALWIYAAPDATNALLNLVSSSFTCVAHGSPTFTTNIGFTGVDASTTVYLDTQLDAGVGTPNFTQNLGHVSAWSNTNLASSASGGAIIGCAPVGTSTALFPRYSDNLTYFRINDFGGGVATVSGQGHFIGTRSSSSQENGYRNGSDVGAPTTASTGLSSGASFYVLAYNDTTAGTANVGFGGQCCSASIGGSLSVTDASNLYTRLRTYMTAMGVP